MMRQTLGFLGLICVLLTAQAGLAASPIVMDSRIRTYIYNPNEVFKMTTEYGYQSNIELGQGETVETLSLGDVSGFKITPNGNRIFLRALKPDFHTNMTLITNKRIYYFDLTSFVERNEDIIYVLRFYYPEHDMDLQAGTPLDAAAFLRPAPKEAAAPPAIPLTVPAVRGATPPPPPPVVSRVVPPAPAPSFARPAQLPPAPPPSPRNLAYSLQGPDRFAPWQVFDENLRTFIQFPEGLAEIPPIYAVGADGRPLPLPTRQERGYIVLDGVFDRLFIGQGVDQVTVFNDRRFASPPPPPLPASRNGFGG